MESSGIWSSPGSLRSHLGPSTRPSPEDWDHNLHVKQQIDTLGDDESNNTSQTHEASQSRPKSRYVHTLNAPSGFKRKLHAVGIQLSK
jgi:hypothetical protein